MDSINLSYWILNEQKPSFPGAQVLPFGAMRPEQVNIRRVETESTAILIIDLSLKTFTGFTVSKMLCCFFFFSVFCIYACLLWANLTFSENNPL